MKLPKGVLYIVVAVVAGFVATMSVHKYVSIKTRWGQSLPPRWWWRLRRSPRGQRWDLPW